MPEAIQDGLRRIYLRPLDRFETEPLKGTEHALTMFFSPDGSQLGFVSSDRAIRTISLVDRTVALVTTGADYWGGTWLEDGTMPVRDAEGPRRHARLVRRTSSRTGSLPGALSLWNRRACRWTGCPTGADGRKTRQLSSICAID